jgi:hypothetical protein
MYLDIAPYAFVGSTLVCMLVGTVIFGAVLVFELVSALLDLAPSLNDANTRFRSAGWSFVSVCRL